jgi:hypothetical protein
LSKVGFADRRSSLDALQARTRSDLKPVCIPARE